MRIGYRWLARWTAIAAVLVAVAWIAFHLR